MDALLDMIAQQGLALPMPQTQRDRWLELVSMHENVRCGTNIRVLNVGAQDYEAIQNFAHQYGVSPPALCRAFIHVGIRALQTAELDDQHRRASSYMAQALQYAQYLSPNDRRFAREKLLETQNTMSAKVEEPKE